MTKTEATIADLTIAASMTEPHESMEIPRVRVVELLDEIERLRAIEQQGAPADWWARFRAAADAAEKAGYLPAAAQLREVSNSVALDVVEDIGRALLGDPVSR